MGRGLSGLDSISVRGLAHLVDPGLRMCLDHVHLQPLLDDMWHACMCDGAVWPRLHTYGTGWCEMQYGKEPLRSALHMRARSCSSSPVPPEPSWVCSPGTQMAALCSARDQAFAAQASLQSDIERVKAGAAALHLAAESALRAELQKSQAEAARLQLSVKSLEQSLAEVKRAPEEAMSPATMLASSVLKVLEPLHALYSRPSSIRCGPSLHVSLSGRR